jgi:hypothetical protein
MKLSSDHSSYRLWFPNTTTTLRPSRLTPQAAGGSGHAGKIPRRAPGAAPSGWCRGVRAPRPIAARGRPQPRRARGDRFAAMVRTRKRTRWPGTDTSWISSAAVEPRDDGWAATMGGPRRWVGRGHAGSGHPRDSAAGRVVPAAPAPAMRTVPDGGPDSSVAVSVVSKQSAIADLPYNRKRPGARVGSYGRPDPNGRGGRFQHAGTCRDSTRSQQSRGGCDLRMIRCTSRCQSRRCR